MRFKLLTLIVFTSLAATSQLTINNQIADSILYNPNNYVQLPTLQQASNGIHTVVYNNTLNLGYQMKKVYMDSAHTKLLSTTFYHNSNLHGPHESYQMNSLLVKGRYKNGKPDG